MEKVVLASPAPVWVRKEEEGMRVPGRSVQTWVKKRLISCFQLQHKKGRRHLYPRGKDGDIWV